MSHESEGQKGRPPRREPALRTSLITHHSWFSLIAQHPPLPLRLLQSDAQQVAGPDERDAEEQRLVPQPLEPARLRELRVAEPSSAKRFDSRSTSASTPNFWTKRLSSPGAAARSIRSTKCVRMRRSAKKRSA